MSGFRPPPLADVDAAALPLLLEDALADLPLDRAARIAEPVDALSDALPAVALGLTLLLQPRDLRLERGNPRFQG